MRCERLFLKDYYSFLGDNGKNPTLDLYLPFNMDEMNRQNRKRPCIVICPGGGYGFVSQREAEALAVHFITEGFNAFVLTYSIAPHTFPSQMLEVAAVMECEGTISEIGSTVHPHPTVSEAVMEAAHACHGNSVHAPKARK